MLLRKKDKEALEQIFSSSETPIEVWAYGSRVNGNAHEGSDLDLVVLSKNRQRLPPELYLRLNEKIKNSNIPILVELWDWAMLPESFHRNIEQQHEVLFTNTTPSVNEPPVDYNANRKSS
jgi:predicted nucleotidyltransferase